MELPPLVLPNREPIPLRLPPFHLRSAVVTSVIRNRDNAVLEQFVTFAGLGLCVADQVPVPWGSGGLAECDWDLVRFGRRVAEALERAIGDDAAAWSKVNAAAYAVYLRCLVSVRPPTKKEVDAARDPFDKTDGSRSDSNLPTGTKEAPSAG
jgi:hypothetical protein